MNRSREDREPSARDKNKQRPRLKVPPGDPFVRDSLRMARTRLSGTAPRKTAPRTTNEDRRSQNMAYSRRRYSVLGLGIAVIAMIVYGMVQFTSPSIIVHLEGGRGLVLVDGQPVGLTERRIRMLDVGKHVIEVIPADSTRRVVPEKLEVVLRYKLRPTELRFHLEAPLPTSPAPASPPSP